MLAALLLAVALSNDPAAFVRSLYEAEHDAVYAAESREDLERTFDAPLAALIWRDKVDAMGEVGRMDANWLYDAQDDEVTNLRVETVENAGDRARVVASFAFPSEKRSIEFQLRRVRGGWRIVNVVYPSGDFISYLKAPFPNTIDSDEMAGPLCDHFADYEITQPHDATVDPVELAEKFANGNGVRQDLGAAIHFVCAAEEIAPMERYGMLDHLQQMRRGDTTEALDFCDHASGGHGASVCAERRRKDSEIDVRTRFERVRKNAPASIDALRARADAFVQADAISRSDINRGGTIHAAVLIDNGVDGAETFIAALERYSRERAPAATDADAKRVDADLNVAYRERIAGLEPIDADHLRDAQRAWIAYRDGFAAYYADRWRASAPPETLRRELITQLTRERTSQLTEE
jgi:uncharacterized protein YecT (DUF1311 family)